jgi:hypothetical protein
MNLFSSYTSCSQIATIMDNSTPWIPTLKGQVLQIQTIIQEQAVSRLTNDPSWVKVTLGGAIARVPKAEVALWDCILGIWRLKETAPEAEDDGEDNLWRDHVLAWLVHSDYSY